MPDLAGLGGNAGSTGALKTIGCTKHIGDAAVTGYRGPSGAFHPAANVSTLETNDILRQVVSTINELITKLIDAGLIAK
ncbi:MAG: hypothetical protein AB7D36_08655 [Oscillospiraceae bacterium]